MKTKQARERIAELERKLLEAKAAQVHNYHFADAAISKATGQHMMGSGVIITITALGGREIVGPTMILDGLSEDSVAALKADLVRSYQKAIEFKPKGG